MKQLVHAFNVDDTTSHVIVGLNDRAFAVFNEKVVVELLAQSVTSSTGDQAENDRDQQPEIRAVALTKCDEDNKIWYAVARHDKTLALYCQEAVAQAATTTSTSLSPVIVHKTSRRLSSLCFATVPPAPNSTVGPLTVVISGDLAGDAVAYPLQDIANAGKEVTALTSNTTDGDRKEESDGDDENEGESSSGRLLLGHTASMLTGVRVVGDRIVTSDRDEKIRISYFPHTHIICGYLLGHEAFVSCFDVLANNHQCVSGGGDFTIRLWDCRSYRELASLSLQGVEEECGTSSSLLPVKVMYDQTGTLVAAIYDESPYLDLFRVERASADNRVSLSRCCRLTCDVRPLALTILSGNRILVVAQEPLYAQVFQIMFENSCEDKTYASLQPCDWVPRLTQLVSDVQMPSSILERDRQGNLNMAKIGETRGPVQQWNDASRKEKARERKRRSKKKRIDGTSAESA